VAAGVAEPVVGPSTPSGVSSSLPRDGGRLLDLVGDVPWEWLAGCRACGRPHPVRPDPRPGQGYVTWAAGGDGHSYQPRVHRWQLDALLVEYRTAASPPAGGQ
jgi:hypothetical protein